MGFSVKILEFLALVLYWLLLFMFIRGFGEILISSFFLGLNFVDFVE